ncbi:EAL domain-containing protein [uncultured Desulfuromonas sp.]|uniref:putative bifunctional diguanylate cyclase/phosphodiesterase n=1 Tax=uncultured Desulfuromonas sp. TaxID=181013 RepID=UPI002AAA78CB|nr:EAL domain-containing protein [uncultured Desulfuromonas sp.]
MPLLPLDDNPFKNGDHTDMERRKRAEVIINIRWLLLIFAAVGSALAIAAIPFGADLNATYVAVLGLGLIVLTLYNCGLHLLSRTNRHPLWIDRGQLTADTVLVSTLIFFSGAEHSWLWPLYVVIALEATFLLRRPREVVIISSLGAALFAAILCAGNYGNVPQFNLHLLDNIGPQHTIGRVLLWLWACFLGGSATLIGSSFNSALTNESQETLSRENQLQRFMESAQDLIFAFDADNRIHYLNEAARQRLGVDISGPALHVDQILDESELPRWNSKTCLLTVGTPFEPTSFRLRSAAGHELPVDCRISTAADGGTILHWVVCRDLSTQLENEKRLYNLSNFDQLTGLTNRQEFSEQATNAMRLTKRLQQQMAVALISIDHLKVINETLTSEVGDSLLREFSVRLSQGVRETDLVGRLSGNQFAVAFTNIDDIQSIEQVMTKLRKKLSQPMTIGDQEMFVTSSVGLSIYPGDALSVESLLKKANSARYYVRAHGGNKYQFYTPEMDEDIKNRLEMINGLHNALVRDELQLSYQPKVNLAEGEFHSVEVLLRWSHPTLGQVSPSDFIPMAEESGMIGELTLWVLRQACLQVHAWQKQGLPPIRVAVNVSGHQLQSSDFITVLTDLLNETGLDPQWLEIEITESVLMQSPTAAIATLNKLRKLGIHLAIDDFGTGYSSLAYLKRFPVHSLKIDRSFIKDIEQSERYATITSSIIEMGKSLHLTVIAEGVETLGQMAFLKEQNCDEIQGFLYSMPVNADEIVRLKTNLQDQTCPLSSIAAS